MSDSRKIKFKTLDNKITEFSVLSNVKYITLNENYHMFIFIEDCHS